MFSFNAEKIENNICKNHSARSERESCRVSPTKLSRQKLEDLYFSLLDSNLELKQTVNSQNEKIKVMSTKLLRLMETRKIISGKDQKQCCAAATAVVIEQKNENEDLKHKNLILSERIRILNMRLCSAKQFMKTSPQSVYKAGRCRTAPIHSVKISSSTNILSAKNNDGNLHSSNERLVNETNSRNVSTRTVETEISEKEILQLCDENRCKVVKEELEQRIVLLQEKIDKMEMENANKVSQLRSEIEKLQLGCADAERCMRKIESKAETLAKQYRDATTRCDELSMQLSIERKKVAELETELKLVQMSEKRTILEPHETSYYLQSPLKDSNDSKYSNDSGYTDEKSPVGVVENKKQFLEKMIELQIELDTLKSSIDNELMNQDRESFDLKIKKVLNSDVYHKVKYTEESFEMKNDEAKVEIGDTNNAVEVDIVKAKTDYIEKSITCNKSNDTIDGDHRTDVESSKLNVISDDESEKNVELENTITNNDNNIGNESNKPLLSQSSNDKINTKNNSQKRVKNINKVIKSKSVDDKNNSSQVKGSNETKYKRASVDLPLVFNVTNVKPQSVAMEVKFEKEFEVTEEKELLFDGDDIDEKDERPLSARTYTLSPDTTRQELSALSDLPLERDVCRLMSPGEVNEASQSLSASSSNVEFGSLSEGELSGGTRLSMGEREVVNSGTDTSVVHQESTSQRVASTMREVCEQMSRCKRLIAAARNPNL